MWMISSVNENHRTSAPAGLKTSVFLSNSQGLLVFNVHFPSFLGSDTCPFNTNPVKPQVDLIQGGLQR